MQKPPCNALGTKGLITRVAIISKQGPLIDVPLYHIIILNSVITREQSNLVG